MKPKRFLLVCALLALGLSACGQPESGANAGQNDSSGQFLADRGGSPAPEGAADSMNQGESMMGVIEKVDGRSVQLKRPMLGQSVTVQLAENAKILMQADAEPSEIQKGDQVSVTGQQQGDVLNAEFVQVGSAGALGGGPMSVGAPTAPSGAPNQVQGGGENAAGSGISGTVEQVDGTKLSVKGSDGKTVTVQLAENASIRKQKQVGPEALEAGKFVIATGAQKGDSFEISEMEVLPPPGAP